jgi:hypothetical protein
MKMHLLIKYAFAALLLVGANSAYSSTLWFWSHSQSSLTKYATIYDACAPSVAEFCGAYPNACYVPASSAANPRLTPSPYGGCQYYDATHTAKTLTPMVQTTGTCPSGYVDNGSGLCEVYVPPAYTCEANRAMYAQVSKLPDGSFPDTLCQAQTAGETNYCTYASDTVAISPNDSMSILYITPESPISCSTPDTAEIIRLPFTPSSFTAQLTEQDTRVVSSEDSFLPPESVCVSNGDGTNTCTTISETVQNTIEGKGTQTSSDGDISTQTTTQGDTTTKTTTNTQVDDGNGNTYVTIRGATSTTAGGSTTTTHDANASTSTTETVPAGLTKTVTSTETTTTNADGTTTKTTTTDTATKPTDATADGNCGAPNQPACSVSLGPDTELIFPKNNVWVNPDGELALAMDAAFNDNKVKSDSLDNYILEKPPFDFTSLGGTTCDPSMGAYTYHGVDSNFLTGFCILHDQTIRPALYWFFAGLTFIFVFNRFNRLSEIVASS